MKAGKMNLRNMPSGDGMASMAQNLDQTALNDVVARESSETVTADNPSKEYVTGSGRPPAPLGAKGRL